MFVTRFAGGIAVCVIATCLVAGCAGAPTVSAVYSDDSPSCKGSRDFNCHYLKQSGKGVYYYLPRTEIELQIDLKRETVSPGRLGKYIALCKGDTHDPDCLSEAKFHFKAATADSDKKLCTSTDDKGKDQSDTFYSLGDKTAVTALAVPDPTHLNFVEVTPKWWQTTSASLVFSDTGLPSEMTAGGTNVTGKEIVSAAIAIGAAVFFKSTGREITFLSSKDVQLGIHFATPVPNDNLDRAERRAIVMKLDAIATRRDSIVLNAPINGDAAPILAALEVREKELRAVFEGKVKVDSLMLVRNLSLRDESTSTLGPDIKREVDGSIASIVPTIEIPGCAKNGNDPDPLALPIKVAFKPEPNSSAITDGQDLSRPTVESDQQGFRYRVPLPAKVTLIQRDAPADKIVRLIDRDFPLEIAQLGPTLTLPRKAGMWGGTVGANFVGLTGRLKQFKSDSAAGPAGEIVTQVTAEVAKDRRTAALEKEEHELDLKAKIKEHNDALAGKKTDDK